MVPTACTVGTNQLHYLFLFFSFFWSSWVHLLCLALSLRAVQALSRKGGREKWWPKIFNFPFQGKFYSNFWRLSCDYITPEVIGDLPHKKIANGWKFWIGTKVQGSRISPEFSTPLHFEYELGWTAFLASGTPQQWISKGKSEKNNFQKIFFLYLKLDAFWRMTPVEGFTVRDLSKIAKSYLRPFEYDTSPKNCDEKWKWAL